jgi:N-glycosylase/DNA lyase
MPRLTRPTATLERVKALHRRDRTKIRARLLEFSSVPETEYFYELAYCILTPQSSARNADQAVRALRDLGFLERGIDPEPLLRRKESYIRFHRTKARHLLLIREQYPEIARQIASGGTGGPEIRKWLVGNVKGLGWKEASHFLRNIGHRGLAILDRHILKNLHGLRVVSRLPRTLTAKNYLAIERKFLEFSSSVGIPVDELDLLFWSMETGEILK